MVSTTAAFLLLIRASAAARATADDADPPKPFEGAPIGGSFEQYVLALYFQPAWSQGDCDSATTAKVNGSTAASHLSIHGLWPNYAPAAHDGYAWPQFCKNATTDYGTCDPDPKPGAIPLCDVPSGVATEMANAWAERSPAHRWGGLAAHEYAKHGSCVGDSMLDYFRVVDYTVRPLIAQSGGKLVTASVGKNVTYADLAAAFSDDAGGRRVALGCTRACQLSDVWFSWDIQKLVFLDTGDASSCESCRAGVHIIDFAKEGCS